MMMIMMKLAYADSSGCAQRTSMYCHWLVCQHLARITHSSCQPVLRN